jgi:hypothetical protein
VVSPDPTFIEQMWQWLEERKDSGIFDFDMCPCFDPRETVERYRAAGYSVYVEEWGVKPPESAAEASTTTETPSS